MNQILASQVSRKRSEINEKSLIIELSNYFEKLKQAVLSSLEEYWSEYHLLQGQINLICSPIHESHKEYYEILEKHIKKEYKLGEAEGKRLHKLAKKRYEQQKKKTPKYALKEHSIPLSALIQKDDLFAPMPYAQDDLLNSTFTASERTLARVDKDINNIISEGYASGKGINHIGNTITQRFDQLKTWEAKRIARTEIHMSHNTGTMSAYESLGVEYTQWDCRIDGRERDSHRELDGEIIRMGGTYSNGLRYPGDSSTGKLREFINCRCGNLPFIMPYGYIAPPGRSRFREGDLVTTLDYFNADDLIENTMREFRQTAPEVLKPINPNILNDFKINPIPNINKIGKKRHPIPLTRETVKQYPKDFLTHKYYDFQNYSSTIARHYESYYDDAFMNKMKKRISGNTLQGTKSIYDSFKYGCGNNFGRLNAYYRDKSKYISDLRKLGETEKEIRTVTERFDKIEENMLNGMKQAIPLTEDTFTYRATSTNHEIPLKVGERGTFKGFTSTSFDKETPLIYYQKDSKKYNVFYNILNPKGTRGMVLESSTKFTNTNGQAELLLPETEYEIVHVIQNGNNYEITVKLINQII